jgi:hypothetical protein
MDNPLQAEGAARGIEASAAWGIEADAARGIGASAARGIESGVAQCIHSRTTTTTPPINHQNHSSDNSVTSFPVLNSHIDKKISFAAILKMKNVRTYKICKTNK